MPGVVGVVLAAALGASGLALTRAALTFERSSPTQTLWDVVAIAVLVAARDPAATLWQAPGTWDQLVRLTTVGTLAAVALYLASAVIVQAHARRHLAPRESLAAVLVPFLFNFVLSLGAHGLMAQLGGWATLSTIGADETRATIGRALVLFVFVEVMIGALRVIITGRPAADLRLHGLMAVAAVHAALTPVFADIPQHAVSSGLVLQSLAAVVAAGLAQSGLWAIVFLLTGLAIEGLSGTPPTFAVARLHWRGGLLKGLIYGSMFMLLVAVAAAFLRNPALVHAARSALFVAAAIGGALLFPLAQTIVASADGTPPFFGRLAKSYRNPRSYLRGIVVGLGAALALSSGLRNDGGFIRFVALFAVGALAYGGVDLFYDGIERLRGRRHVLETWRFYALGLGLGGLVAGALGWYFDAPQIDVVAAKFWAYADFAYQPVGRAVNSYTTYPWFNKWGALDLGPVAGGTRLFFNESVAGLINWSIAAPLFGINFFFLAALFQRSLLPLKQLLSPKGFEGLVEQAVRVLRWGLWMSPIINSFLRQSPDPSWYNQDGAVRSVVATAVSAAAPTDVFRRWSLTLFTGLLAYDWLRVLIWFDHMGLRVATLVNLSFIGGDRADELAARFAGHAGRTRIIPEGIRRFATWAPLMIPFYIPRGAEWDTAWTGAEHIRQTAPRLPTPVFGMTIVYAVAAALAAGGAFLIARRWGRADGRAAARLPGVPRTLEEGRATYELSNGFLRVELMPDGRGYTRVEGVARKGDSIDLNRRPTDPLQLRGPFFYLRDAESGRSWSIGYQPAGAAGADYAVRQPQPNCFSITNTVEGIRAEAEVSLSAEGCVEIWRIRLSDVAGRRRRVLLTSLRELALHAPGSYVRDPDFNAMHVQTWFIGSLHAVLARNRLLHDPNTHRTSAELYVHAVDATQEGVRLLGYEDSRTRFIGGGDLRRPDGLEQSRLRGPGDEGSLYTFDPAASLTLSVDLPARGNREVRFLDAHAADAAQASAIVAGNLDLRPPSDADLKAAMERRRALDPSQPPPATDWPFAFSADGTELHLSERTPRPWAHVLANASGIGAVVGNDGEIHSFAGNERQNALTPFSFESVATSLPGQLIYVVDLETGEADTASFVPYRRKDARHDVTFGLGSVVFRSKRPDTELELTFFVLGVGPADIRILTIRNRLPRAREFRVVPYLDMVLAENPGESLGRIEASREETTEALLFTNPANDFVKGWAFAATSLTAAVTETVRSRFVGSAGRDLTNPIMVETGAPDGSRPDDGRRVASFAGVVKVPANGEADIVVVLGQAETRHQAIMAASHLRDPAVARATLEAARSLWRERLDLIRIETNQPAFDRLVNYWLPYQVLTSRLWGRTGPNQRGGAIGYRDQLQDVLPLLFFDPNLTRRQIVLHAGQQFPEGDVLKWWHLAPDGRTGYGQRTYASDPHLWLPYVVVRYLAATGDHSVLNEKVAYLEGPPIPPGSVDLFMAPRASLEIGDVYDHCVRAIDHALARMGRHGLPLIGTGDWNDSLDVIGVHDKGESVWLGFFLHDILVGFSGVSHDRQDHDAAARYRDRAGRLKAALDAVWAVDRYPLAFDDSGKALDMPSAMTSAWAILSGAADAERGRVALDSGLAQLERSNHILLLTPPFDDNSKPYPGRIADYPPGVRENGGQYSHGVSWTVDAYMRLADLAKEGGDPTLAAAMAARAFACWVKISPIGKTDAEHLATYGLAPHQQPADIYDGDSYDGRGGWSWYTGSAARMLSAAYAILGLTMAGSEVTVPDDVFAPKGELVVKSICVKGRTLVRPQA